MADRVYIHTRQEEYDRLKEAMGLFDANYILDRSVTVRKQGACIEISPNSGEIAEVLNRASSSEGHLVAFLKDHDSRGPTISLQIKSILYLIRLRGVNSRRR